MKKSLYLFIIIAAVLLTGCSKPDKMTNFIPTPAPSQEEDSEDTQTEKATDKETTDESATEATPTPKEVYVGQTTPMYVKLDEYGATLNIRLKPSKDSDAVGFLVHAEQVNVIEIKDGWASFEYNGQICYVNADYLVDKQPEYIDPPTPAPEDTKEPASESVSPNI